MNVKYFSKKPHFKNKLGTVKYGERKVTLYNIDGSKPTTVLYSPHIKKYMVSKSHIGTGHMLNKLGFEVNAGGGLFRHYSLPIKSFKGMSRKQILAWQRKSR